MTSSPSLRDRLAGVLGEHRALTDQCSCGYHETYGEQDIPSRFHGSVRVAYKILDPDSHRAHVATILADLVAGEIRAGKADALREAGDATYKLSEAKRGTPDFDLWLSDMTERDIAAWLRARADTGADV